MRLLDRIFSDGLRSLGTKLDIPRTLEYLRASQLVVIDNIAKYHFQELPKKLERPTLDLKATDFPNVMLPFETTFLEMKMTSSMYASGVAGFEEVGILARMYKPEATNFDKTNHIVGSVLFHKDVAYHLVGLLFVYTRETGKVDYIANFTVPVNQSGQVVSLEDDVFPFIGMLHLSLVQDSLEVDKDKQNKDLFLLATAYLFPCLLALSFMHCRNVKVMEEIPSPKLSKKWQKKTGKPLLKYRVLQIDHMKEILEKQGQASTQGLKHALHICRGHFKTYGRDGKGLLFGKHAATVWIPMHTRGSKEEGVVVKDYEVMK